MSVPFVHTLQKIAKDFEEFTVDVAGIHCIPCNRSFVFRSRRDCQRHLQSQIHKRASSSNRVTREDFFFDLCEVFCACGLSWRIVENPDIEGFFFKYTPDFPLPSSHTLRKHYLPRVYERVMDNIKRDVQNNFLWVSVEETTDFHCNKVINVVIRILNASCATPPILSASKPVIETTAKTMEEIVRDALSSVYATNENVLMLVTDRVAYMVNAGKQLKDTYKNLIHVTCLAHALHRVAEPIREQYPVVDALIWNTKNVFKETSSRNQAFKERFPDVPLVPQPVRTRWCTWIHAAIYFATNFSHVKTFMLQLDPNDSRATKRSQWAFRQPHIYTDLCDIAGRFKVLAAAATKLESGDLRLSETLSVIKDAQTELSQLTDNEGKAINNKLTRVLQDNQGYRQMCQIHENILHGELVPDHVNHLEFAPLTSVDIERSFSLYERIYKPNRSCVTPINVERILVVAMYAKAKESLPPR